MTSNIEGDEAMKLVTKALADMDAFDRMAPGASDTSEIAAESREQIRTAKTKIIQVAMLGWGQLVLAALDVTLSTPSTPPAK